MTATNTKADIIAALPPLSVAGRDQLVREELARRAGSGAADGSAQPDTLVVFDLNNIRWLTGFTGSAGTLIVRPDEMVLVTDGRYGVQSRAQIEASGAAARVVVGTSAAVMREGMEQALSRSRAVAVDPSEVTHAQFEALRGQTPAALVALGGVVQHLRRRKTPAEIARMRRAAACTDAALAECVEMMGNRPTERDVRDELEYRMRRHGADGPSYDTIVATGANGARPHHRPTSTVIEEGHLVVIDVGGLVDGYHSDMTRTYLIGEVDPVLRRMHDVVRESQLAGLAAVRAGITAGDVDKTCRDIIADAGFGGEFIHSTGHGVGLQIHEQPWVRTGMPEPLQPGEVVTVEPGVYREGLGGVRIEDLVVVTDTGCDILTATPKDLSCQQLAPTN
ncbi:MAG: aminopeptidase P family protein [Actinobacteria bacterium]|nr:aminopeptidase P family protein [Actinomycetota bacterium]